MAKREKYSASFECPKCKKKGIAEWEENENPVYSRGLSPVLISVSCGFTKSTNRIECNDCKVSIPA